MGHRVQAGVEGGRDGGGEEKVGAGREGKTQVGEGRREGPSWGGQGAQVGELGSNPRHMRCWPFSRTKCS